MPFAKQSLKPDSRQTAKGAITHRVNEQPVSMAQRNARNGGYVGECSYIPKESTNGSFLATGDRDACLGNRPIPLVSDSWCSPNSATSWMSVLFDEYEPAGAGMAPRLML